MRVLKSLNFGTRGWILLIFSFTAFISQAVFPNYTQNMLADLYGGAVTISLLYTGALVAAIVTQLVMSLFISRIKSMKKFSIILGIVTLVSALGIMYIPASWLNAWYVCYFIVTYSSNMWAVYAILFLVGQWFPTKKGTFMGVSTLAFPIVNGLMGAFAGNVFKNGIPDVAAGFWPYWIVVALGFILGTVFVTEYPEQVGAFRDNDKSMTAEKATAMMEAEIEAKKTSVWKTGKTLSSIDYWLVTIPIGLLLFCAVGMMTRTAVVIGSFGAEMDRFGGFGGIMFFVMVLGIVGSFGIGLIDTAIGTKKAILLSCVLMLISGVLGLVGNATLTVLSIWLLAVFMGASSNFTVSIAAQYWRREDYANIFGVINPVANILQAIGPACMAIAITLKGPVGIFILVTISGVVSVICMLVFKPKRIKKVDDKLRMAAGKELTDELSDRR